MACKKCQSEIREIFDCVKEGLISGFGRLGVSGGSFGVVWGSCGVLWGSFGGSVGACRACTGAPRVLTTLRTFPFWVFGVSFGGVW